MRSIASGRREALAGLGLALAGLSGAAPAHAAGEPRRGGVLRVSAPTNPSTLDPIAGTAGSDHVYLYALYDALVDWDPKTMEPRPGLAESWSWPDPETLVLNLRPGIQFHDGTLCDAEAVKFNLDRGKTDPSSNVKPELTSVRAVRTEGATRVIVELNQPDTALPLILSDRAGMMCSPTAVRERGARFGREPVGVGPWKFVSWANDEKVTVTRHTGYWRKDRPWLDGIEISVIGEVNTGLRSVIGGQNDFVYFLAPQQKAIVDRAKSLVPVTGPTTWCVQLYLNYGRKPLDDRRVRQAMNLSIDRDAFNKATANGLAEPAYCHFPTAHWAFDKDAASVVTYDPDRAKQLLAEAGYKDGIDLDCFAASDQRTLQREEVLVEQWKKVGIRAHFAHGVIPNSTAQFFIEKQHDAYLSTWTGRPDPTQTYQLGFGKDAFYNPGRTDPVAGLAAALVDSRRDQDQAARKKAFAKLQRMVAENALFIPLQFQFEMDAHVQKMRGYQPNLLGKPRFLDVWLES
jgi:peptide/nickel transport system permease protein/peptide/nickel transport system substrate-binding protein